MQQGFEKHNQEQSRKLLQSLHDRLQNEGLGIVRLCLDSLKQHHFRTADGQYSLILGYVSAGSKEALLLYPGGRTNIAFLLERSHEDILQDVNEQVIGDKQPFDWDQNLYRGLFHQPMDPRSKALLQYCFVRAAAKFSAHLAGSGLQLDVENLILAARAISESDAVKTYKEQLKANSEKALAASSPIGPRKSPTLHPGTAVPPRHQSYGLPNSSIVSHSGSGLAASQNAPANKISAPEISKALDVASKEIEDIEKKYPNFRNLPDLSLLKQEGVIQSFQPSDDRYLPVRILLGSSKEHGGNSKVWLYLLKEEDRKGKGILKSPYEIEYEESGEVKRIMCHCDSIRNEEGFKAKVSLVEPFASGQSKKAWKTNDALEMLGRYYFFHFLKEEGIDIAYPVASRGEFVRYLKTAVNAYNENDSEGTPGTSTAKPILPASKVHTRTHSKITQYQPRTSSTPMSRRQQQYGSASNLDPQGHYNSFLDTARDNNSDMRGNTESLSSERPSSQAELETRLRYVRQNIEDARFHLRGLLDEQYYILDRLLPNTAAEGQGDPETPPQIDDEDY